MELEVPEINELKKEFGALDGLSHNYRDLDVVHHESQDRGTSHHLLRAFAEEVRLDLMIIVGAILTRALCLDLQAL